MSPAEGIAAILTGAGTIIANGWSLRVGLLGSQDNCLVVIDQPGRTPEPTVSIDYPAVQIIGRGSKAATSYSTLFQKLTDVKTLLHAIAQNPTAFPELVSCLVRGGVTTLGNDDSDRPQMSLNFNLITAPAVSGNRDPI